MNDQNKGALHKEIENAKKYADELVGAFTKKLKVRFDELKDELKTVVWTQWQAYEKRYAEAMEQVTQRQTGIEDALADMRVVVDDIQRELTNNANTISERLDDLQSENQCQRQDDERERAEQTKTLSDRLTAVERVSDDLKREVADFADDHQRLNDRLDERFDVLQSDYRRQRQDDEQQQAEQTKLLTDRLTTIEQQSGELRRDFNDGNKRLADLAGAYWSNREKDERQRAEQIQQVSDKLSMFDRQVVDVAHELKEVQHDLKRANDLTQRLHEMEMRQDERRIREQESKRGPQGIPGPKGAKGETGAAGKDGHTVVLKTKRWETDDAEFLLREVLSDGSRMPAANLRPMVEGNFRPLFERLLPELDQRYESMMEDLIAKAMRRSSYA